MDTVARQNPVVSITSNCGNTLDSYKNVWNNCNISVSDGKLQVLEWLSPLTSRERHEAVRDTRVDGVGDWMLCTPSFCRWRTFGEEGAKPVLLCYGDPGVGKTYISSLVIDTLRREVGAGNVVVTYVYCDFSARNVRSASAVLGSVLRQVVGALPETPAAVQKAFEDAKKQGDGCGLRLPEILGMLIGSLSSLKRSYICIDALDEFPWKQLPELWESLQRVISKCPSTRLFLTGRPHIREGARKYFRGTSEMLPIIPKEQDTELYLRMRLDRDPEFDAMDEGLRADILRVIPKKISGIFLLVCINMDAILAEPTIYQRRQALDRVTNGLGLQDAYKTTLDRIKQQGGSKARLGMEALMWISHCGRPLRSEELCHALGVELGEEDFNMHNAPSIRTVLGCALGLVTISKWGSTVRLLHPTLQEYLGGNSTMFVTAHLVMAEVCLTYLNYRSVRALPPNPHTNHVLPPFLEYAACFWGAHAAREVTGSLKSLALQVLDGYENHVSAGIFWRKKARRHLWEKDVQGISGLHSIAFWGILEIATAMLEIGIWDVNRHDSEGKTALVWAIKYGNGRMVELLLGQGEIKPDTVDLDGCTALSFAAWWGNEGAVKLFLERRNVNPNIPDRGGRTPLLCAVGKGYGGIVKLLLERADVDPNISDLDSQTPLLCAVGRGYRGIVKLLLERADVNPNIPDRGRQTPLLCAVGGRCGDVVKLLLGHGDTDPNTPDRDSRTPLLLAILWREWVTAKLLLERGGVDPNYPDSNGRTPLSYTAEAGALSIIKLLLERGDLDPDSPDYNGQTPLSFAARKGHKSVVKLLLERPDVYPDSPDYNGQTPLSFAAWKGHKSVVKLLLERPDVYPDSLDSCGQTPLSFAASRGHGDVVKLLLKRGGVNPNTPDRCGRAPLFFAISQREHAIIRLLLRCRDANPNISDSRGRTPLLFAVVQGFEGVVRLLLEHGDVNPNLPDSNSLTPLSFAVWNEYEGIVRLLLERGDANPDSFDSSGRTSLSYAAQRGCGGIVKLLLQRDDVNPNSTDHGGRTPLSFAAEQGERSAVKLLLQRGDVDPNLSDNAGRTPLSFATRGRHGPVVKLLLECGNPNPNTLFTR